MELINTEPLHGFKSLQSDETAQDLAEFFASYLRSYRDVRISHQGIRVDPASAIANTRSYNLADIQANGEYYPVRLEIVEWRRTTKRALYLCNGKGFPLSQVETRFHVGGHHFSAYLVSTYVEQLHDNNTLQLGDLTPGLGDIVEEARNKIKEHFRKRSAEAARGVVDRWKAEESYPYAGNPTTTLEEIERQRFDIVAVTGVSMFRSLQPRHQRRAHGTSVSSAKQSSVVLTLTICNLFLARYSNFLSASRRRWQACCERPNSHRLSVRPTS